MEDIFITPIPTYYYYPDSKKLVHTAVSYSCSTQALGNPTYYMTSTLTDSVKNQESTGVLYGSSYARI